MKSKQRIALFMATLYVVSVLGLALSLHFCGGKLANVELFTSEASCKFCKDIPKEKKDSGCCKDTTVSVKVKDSHQAEVQAKVPLMVSITLFIIQPAVDFVGQVFNRVLFVAANKAPPLSSIISLHILNCIFRN